MHVAPRESLLHAFRSAVRYQGFRVSLVSFLFKAIALVGPDLTRHPRYRRFRDSEFDRRYGVQTIGVLMPEELDVSGAHVGEINQYEASSPLAFHVIISRLGVRFEDYSFVDLGSGMGRTLFMASEYPFRQIIGVELSRVLHDVAVQNISRFRSRTRRCSSLRAVCVDAASFEFPDGPFVLYLYNPFKERILRSVLENLRRSLDRDPRPVLVVYFNATHQAVLDQAGFLSAVDFDERLGPWIGRLMPAHRAHYDEAWVTVYEGPRP